MDAIDVVTKYSFITNKLRYCGPKDSYIKFLEYIHKPTKKLEKEIKEYIKRFEGLYPYLELIAKKSKLKPFDEKVVEAYWIGNELLDDFSHNDLKEMIMSLSKRGLPVSYAKKLCDNIPNGMVPHHSFNVIYVGVGKITGSVKFNIENINNCLIRPAEIVGINKKKIILQHRPFVIEGKKLRLHERKTEEFDYLPNFSEFEETVSIHWKFAVDELSMQQLSNLMKYTFINVQALNDHNEL